MFNWYNLVWALQVIAALAIICLVLLQHGKGADAGAAFGSGASGSLFGASGSSNFLSRSTAIAAAVFFGCTLALAFMGHRLSAPAGGGSVFDNVPAAAAPAAAAPTPAPSAADAAGSGAQSNQIPK